MAYTSPIEISGVRVACINVRGIISDDKKREHLHSWLIRNRIDVVLLQEVCVHHNHDKIDFPITDFPGYLYNKNQKCLEIRILWRENLSVFTHSFKNKYPDGQWREWISFIYDENVLNICSF